MLGNDKDGPASNKASAGPLPIPAAINPCRIGTSVSVAKYIKAPTIEAKKLEKTEFPPTKPATHSFGTIPGIAVLSCVEPSRNPAIKTPIAKRGMICLAKSQVERVHSLFSGSLLSNRVIMLNPAIPTIIGISGDELTKPDRAVAVAARATCCHFILRMAICEYLFFDDIPTKVTLNESIELAKKFSTGKSGTFVNGILDGALKKLNREGRIEKKGKGLIEKSSNE